MNKNTNEDQAPKTGILSPRAKELGLKGATMLTSATVAMFAGSEIAKNFSDSSASANSSPKQEQKYLTYDVQPGDTLEEVAEADLESRADGQAFAQDPTAAEVDVREREIAGDTKLHDPDFTDPNKLDVGQDLYLSKKTEVPIHVTPEVAPEDLPPAAQTPASGQTNSGMVKGP